MKTKNIFPVSTDLFYTVITILIISVLVNGISFAQTLPGKSQKCIVCLTYDDGIDADLDNVAPALDSMGFKGTFYVPTNSESLNKRMDEWKTIAKNRHELGNHTSFHPCNGKSKKRDFVTPDYDLDTYSMQRMVDEIKLANVFLKAIDGKSVRTFAYTCGDQVIAGENLWDKIKNEFVAARGVNGEMPALNEIKLDDIGSYMIANKTGEEMIDMAKMAMKKNSLIVFLFHGVGGGHSINVALNEHSKLLHFLKENEKDIWVAPFLEVAEYAKANQVKK
jgi:peptidoglycan-N-acetylglucosamine deacetylase